SLTPGDAEKDVKSQQFFAVIVPPALVFVDQRLDRGALEPIGDRVRARQQDIPAALAKEGPDQGSDRHSEAVLLAHDDRRRQIAAGQTLQNVLFGMPMQLELSRQAQGVFGKTAVEIRRTDL